MDIGAALLSLARRGGARSVVVLGTAKNAGKTVVSATLCSAAERAGLQLGVTSLGRDGERVDAVDGRPKPRVTLRPGTLLTTAAAFAAHAPALELLARGERAAAGATVVARVRMTGDYEIVGPPSGAAVRRTLEQLFALGAEFAVIDGAVDRVAAAGRVGESTVVACGAAGSATQEEAVAKAATLVARLRLSAYAREVDGDAVFVEGVLNARHADELLRSGERRAVVVEDPTKILLAGAAFERVATALPLRCRRSLNVVACTVASLDGERAFDPPAFARALARATALPVFDVYAGTATAA